MNTVISYVKAHWKTFAIALALVVAFLTGYGLRPKPKIQYVTHDVVKTITVTKDVVHTVTVKVKDTQIKYVTKTVTVKEPTGKETITQVTQAEDDTEEGATKSTLTQHDTQTQQLATRDTSFTQTPTSGPNWRVGALVGLNIGQLKLAQGFSTGPLSYGVEVDRKILGPVWLGVWGLNSGQVGLNLSLTF